MVPRSWSPHVDERGAERPLFAAELADWVGDDLVFSAAGLLETALGLIPARPRITTEGK